MPIHSVWRMLLLAFALCAVLPVGQTITADVLTTQAKTMFLNVHNAARASVKVPALKWNDTLATFAATKTPGTSCTYQHSSGPYGENVFASSPLNSNNTALAEAAVKAWVGEKVNVDPYWNCMTNPNKTCGHYSQW